MCCNIGEYKCQVKIRESPTMNKYLKNRLLKVCSDKIYVDKCIKEEIEYLHNKGIITYGSCCGHGINKPMVNIDEKSFYKIEKLGYKKIINNCNDFTYELKFVLKKGGLK